MKPRIPIKLTSIPDAERPHFVRFALTFAGMIVVWAALHDLYLIGVEPRHFTEFHRPLLRIQSHTLLAIQYATVATLGPGLAFGFLAYFVCRSGNRPKLGLVYPAIGFLLVLIVVEVLVLGIGHYARFRFESAQSTFYPANWYPELSPGIVFTQSVNLSAYLMAPTIGALYLLAIRLLRKPEGSAR